MADVKRTHRYSSRSDSRDWDSHDLDSRDWDSHNLDSRDWDSRDWDSLEWDSRDWDSRDWDSRDWDSLEWDSRDEACEGAQHRVSPRTLAKRLAVLLTQPIVK